MPPLRSLWRGKPEPDDAAAEKIARKYLQFAQNDSFLMKPDFETNGEKRYDILKNNEKVGRMNFFPGNLLPRGIQDKLSTVQWLRQNITLEMAPTTSSDDSHPTISGYSWVLSHYAKGEILIGSGEWQQMTWTAKEKWIKNLAKCHAQLLEPRNRLHGIGQIRLGGTPSLDTKAAEGAFQPDAPIKSFYVGCSGTTGSSTGPYFKSSTWLLARLDSIIQENSTDPSTPTCMCTEHDVDPEELTVSLAKRLQAKLPEVFFPEVDQADETVLWALYLDGDYFRANEHGDIVENSAFDFAKTVPVWRCYELPEVILGSIQDISPAVGDPHYQFRLFNFEKTKLRDVYLATMETVHPGFGLRMKQYQRLIDFAYAVVECQIDDSRDVVKDWLDTWDKGLYYNLRDRLLGPWKACACCGGPDDGHNDDDDGGESDESLPALEDVDEWEDASDTCLSPSCNPEDTDDGSSDGEFDNASEQ